MTAGLEGPAPLPDKLMYRELKERSLPIPAALANVPIARTRKGPLGAIVVRRMSGLVNTRAKRLTDQFEENIGGKVPLEEGLMAVRDTLNKDQLKLLDLLRLPSRKTLSRLMAESGVEVTGVMKAYARGAVELGRVQAVIEAHRNLPALIKDLYTHALSGTGVCDACGGLGKLLGRADGRKETKPCYFCSGSGITSPSDLKQFATTKLLEVTKQTGERGPLVNVQQNVGIRVEGRGSILEKVMAASDEVLFKRNDPPIEEVVEAEIVSS